MSTTVHRTSKSGNRQSLFFHDLASPVSNRRGVSGSGKFTTPGQAAAVSALWRETFATSDLPPPPVFTLEDRSDLSPESGIPDYPIISPEPRSDPRTPFQSSSGRGFLTPSKSKGEASTSYNNNQQSPVGGLSWWLSPAKSGGGGGGEQQGDDKGKGSPVEGVVQPGALITVPPPREVARPEMQRNAVAFGNLDEEEWITVYGYCLNFLLCCIFACVLWIFRTLGREHRVSRIFAVHSTSGIHPYSRFSPGDTNLVLREFEKCGVVLKHVPGPREANWMHILYQNRSDAQKALSKNGMQINGVLIVGVKPVDPSQRQFLNERLKNQVFMPMPPPLGKTSEPNTLRASPHPYYHQNGSNTPRQSAGTIATPAKSVVSKIMDLMFGV
ncbi:hypothetical protein RHGRI_025018 [Rhododendron griersonianum]|uniref:RRM Nup35-type domain-containing protein n=1 Tax=Rhododendron griersonianum TaxID=479676 RepID=A0AAV6JGR6_9ERIC|nr:hypothetical protein RHGRI_025018 [Rhododendron griersonianum]